MKLEAALDQPTRDFGRVGAVRAIRNLCFEFGHPCRTLVRGQLCRFRAFGLNGRKPTSGTGVASALSHAIALLRRSGHAWSIAPLENPYNRGPCSLYKVLCSNGSAMPGCVGGYYDGRLSERLRP